MICEFEKSHDSQLTDHFRLSEFHCQCKHPECVQTILSIDLVQGLELIREHLGGLPMKILSGFRCEAHNREIGGKPQSKHLVGIAADIQVVGVPIYKLAHAAKRVELFLNGGIGMYPTFVHVDHRGHPARW